MSVSSVKNLNGEVFSAVQDASLTNVVQTNSASWGQGGGGGTTVVSGIDNGLIYISAEDAGAIYGKPYNGTYNGFFSAINEATITNNSISITCPEPTIINRIAANSYDYYKYKTSPTGEWIGPVHQFDVPCEFVSNNGVVVIPISSNNSRGVLSYFSAFENVEVTNKLVIPPFIDTDGFVKYSDDNVAFGSTNSAKDYSFALGNRNSANYQSLALGNYNSAGTASVALGYYNNAKYYSQSLGSDNYSNNYSLAVGLHSSADNYSLAGGQRASAYNNSLALGNASADICSLAVGQGVSSKNGSLAVGYYTSAQGYSLAVGNNNSAYSNSFAMGGSKASNNSVAVGSTNRAENYSQAFGCQTTATNSGMAIGKYNITTTAAFVVGNGTWDSHSDAFVIFHDGSVSAAGKISANGVELGAGVPYNMVYTASLPQNPDANTLYLIPEA
jgi:hypothetical protein